MGYSAFIPSVSALLLNVRMTEHAERPGVSDEVRFGLLHITLVKLTSVQSSSAPPGGSIRMLAVFIF